MLDLLRCLLASNTAEHNTLQEAVAPQTVVAMDPAAAKHEIIEGLNM